MDNFVVSSSKRKALEIYSKVKSGRLPSSFVCSTIESAEKRKRRLNSKLNIQGLQIYRMK